MKKRLPCIVGPAFMEEQLLPHQKAPVKPAGIVPEEAHSRHQLHMYR